MLKCLNVIVEINNLYKMSKEKQLSITEVEESILMDLLQLQLDDDDTILQDCKDRLATQEKEMNHLMNRLYKL